MLSCQKPKIPSFLGWRLTNGHWSIFVMRPDHALATFDNMLTALRLVTFALFIGKRKMGISKTDTVRSRSGYVK